MRCPFQVGDRIRNKNFPSVGMTVTALTESGFRWRLDEPYSLGARYGWYQEGECYELGFPHYEKAEDPYHQPGKPT